MGGKQRMDDSIHGAEASVAAGPIFDPRLTADFAENGRANHVGESSRGGAAEASSSTAARFVDGADSPPPDVSSINIEFSRPSKVAKSLDFDRMKQVGQQENSPPST